MVTIKFGKTSLKKRLINLAVIGIAFYCCLVAIMYFEQRTLQYAPDHARPSPVGSLASEMVPVDIVTADGLTNNSWVYINAPDAKTVVFFHGNASNIGGRAQKLRTLIDAGYNVAIVGYRGFGGNPGAPSEKGLFLDSRAVIDYLRTDKHIPINHMIFYGESLGTGVATQMATDYPNIAGLILEVPFYSALSLAKMRYPMVIGLDVLMSDPYRSDLRMPTLTMPKLFLVAGKDMVIPPIQARHLYQIAPEPKQMVEFPDGAHNNLYDFGAGARVVDFIDHIQIQGNK